ncbi:MAG: hypothetical protein R2698_11865 [Microthrixaceae bacterium]
MSTLLGPGVVLAAACCLAVVVNDMVRGPVLRRLALRSISRRRAEALLIISGSTLGTAIICAALVVGDSFQSSLRDVARTRFGPIDIVVTSNPGGDFTTTADALRRRVDASPLPGVDGTLAVTSTPATLRSGGAAASSGAATKRQGSRGAGPQQRVPPGDRPGARQELRSRPRHRWPLERPHPRPR